MADNPHWKVIDAHRGYHLFDIRRDGIDAQVRVVDTVVKPTATPSTYASLRVEAGDPGVSVV
jgi:alkaline phosphatase D